MNRYDRAIARLIEGRKAERDATAKGEKLVTLTEAAEHIGWERWTLYRAVQSGKLKGYPVLDMDGALSSKYLVKLSDVEKLEPATRGRPRKPIGIDS